jgi:hypothetical protein
VAPASEAENLTAISNFWALMARYLIGKSWKIVDMRDFGPACHAGVHSSPCAPTNDFNGLREGIFLF